MLLDWIDMAKLLITILLPLAFLAFTKAESDGPPQEACVSMMPDHYGLTFTKDNVKIDATKNPDGSLAISCELDDGAEFKGWRFFPILMDNTELALLGFLIQVRSSLGTSIGSFNEVDPENNICGYGHTEAGLKPIAKGTWVYGTPDPNNPTDFSQQLSVKCTLVKEYTKAYHGELFLPLSLTSHLGK